MTIILLLLSLLNVTPGPGWSWPIVVTEEPNTTRPCQRIHRDQEGRFHLLWEDYKHLYRIGYKVLLNMANWNPLVHALIADTCWDREGNCYPMPEIDTTYI